jgi:hypothetical protein
LPKGDVYADETIPTPETPIETGDTLEVVIRRGAGEEKFASVVRENGKISVGFMEVDVAALTAAVAEARVQEAAVPYMRQPRVQVLLKKKVLKVKRVFVFGDVKKPGIVPMPRHMTLLQAIAAADMYQETALMEEVRVIRGGDLTRPHILMADLARAFTYGDMTRKTISCLCRANIWAMPPKLRKRLCRFLRPRSCRSTRYIFSLRCFLEDDSRNRNGRRTLTLWPNTNSTSSITG